MSLYILYIQKILFSFLFFCLLQSAYSMESNGEGFFSRIYNKLQSSMVYFSFCRAVKSAFKNGLTQKDCEIIKEYIKKGADPNWKIGEDKLTIISLAVSSQQKDLFEFLLQHNADINACDKNGQTLLHYLILRCGNRANLNINIKDLMHHGVNAKAKTKGFTPLHAAVWRCNINYIKSLVACGADINEKSGPTTPLAFAICNDDTPSKVIKELCKLKASLATDHKNGNNIFHLIVANGSESIKYIKPIITHARCDDFDKGSKQIVPYALWILKHWEADKNIKFPREIILHILSNLPPFDLYPYKNVCKQLLLQNYNHMLLPQIRERVENIKQILASPNKEGVTALQYALEKFAGNHEYLNKAVPLLDGTLLESDFQYFLVHFPGIVNSKLEKDKKNLVRQMFDNCTQLFLE